MCLNCGCGASNDRHGVETNIVADDVVRAAEGNAVDFATAASHIMDALRRIVGGPDRSSGDGGTKLGWAEIQGSQGEAVTRAARVGVESNQEVR